LNNHKLIKISPHSHNDEYFYYICQKCSLSIWKDINTFQEYSATKNTIDNFITSLNDNLSIETESSIFELSTVGAASIYHDNLVYGVSPNKESHGKALFILQCELSDDDFIVKDIIK
jgi:hypothetical protein